MLRIRLSRGGARKNPHYRVIVSDSRFDPTGRFVESLGIYDPRADGPGVRLDVAKTEEWIRKGAHPSESVRSLLERAKSAPPA